MIRKLTFRYAIACHWLTEAPGRLFEVFLALLELWWLYALTFHASEIESNRSFDAFNFLPDEFWQALFVALVGSKVIGWARPRCIRVRYLSAVGSTAVWMVVARNLSVAGMSPTGVGAYTLVGLGSMVLATHFLGRGWGRR